MIHLRFYTFMLSSLFCDFLLVLLLIKIGFPICLQNGNSWKFTASAEEMNQASLADSENSM
jgi:hypothetical protein